MMVQIAICPNGNSDFLFRFVLIQKTRKMKPTCYTNANSYKYNFLTCAGPCLPTGRHHTIKIKIIL